MKTENDFNTFYSSSLSIVIGELEKQRKGVVSSLIRSILIVFGILVFIISLVSLFPDEFEYLINEYTIIQIVFALGIFYLIYFIFRKFLKFRKQYVDDFKDKVINTLVKFIHNSLEYEKDMCITRGEFDTSRIFRSPYNRYSGDDYVSGVIDKTAIKFSELHVKHVTQRDKRTETTPVFNGIFFIGDFNKNFRGSTFVLPDTAEKIFKGLGKFMQSLNPFYGDLVKLENPEFEKEFVVYSSDQIEARYILSLSLMERLLSLKKRLGRKVYFSFINSNINIAIDYNKNLLEPTIIRTLDNFNLIKSYFELLNEMIAIVEELNLNTRIWTKE